MNIDEIELRRLDLTMLLVFTNLVRLRRATDVADHMGLTQSSISHSIKRLRDAFGDPLFLRTPKGMEPTAVALALEPKIRSVIDTLSQAIGRPFEFDPASADDTLRIGAFDNEMTTLVPRFLQLVSRDAPRMRVSILPLARRPAIEALEQGDIDLALGFAWGLPRSTIQTKLYEETYRVVMRRDHPLIKERSTLETYLSAEHLIVSPRGDHAGIVDEELAKIGRARRVTMSVPQFLPALSIVATTDLIATLPNRLVVSQSERYQLASFPPPIAVRPFTVSVMHHNRNSNSPLHQWAIAGLSKIAEAIG